MGYWGQMEADIPNQFSLVNKKEEKYAMEKCQIVSIQQPI